MMMSSMMWDTPVAGDGSERTGGILILVFHDLDIAQALGIAACGNHMLCLKLTRNCSSVNEKALIVQLHSRFSILASCIHYTQT